MVIGSWMSYGGDTEIHEASELDATGARRKRNGSSTRQSMENQTMTTDKCAKSDARFLRYPRSRPFQRSSSDVGIQITGRDMETSDPTAPTCPVQTSGDTIDLRRLSPCTPVTSWLLYL